MAEKDLKQMLQHTLRSPALRKQVKRLGVSQHLEMIHDPLWEINAVLLDAQLRALKDPKFELLADEITAAIADVHYLLGRILDWQPKPSTAPTVAAAAVVAASAAGAAFNCGTLPLPCCAEVPDEFRHALLQEMEQMARTLSLLVSRGTSMDVRKDMMESMDPRQEEFDDILRKEAVQLEGQIKRVTELLQSDQRNDTPLMLALLGGDGAGKTTLARMIFHDTGVRRHFDTRIWVDSPDCLSFDPISVAREITESITEEPCDDLHHLQTMWMRVNKPLIGSRYLLVIDDVTLRKEDNDRWEQLQHVFLRMGLPGSRVIAVSSSPDERMPECFFEKFKILPFSKDDLKWLFSNHAMIPVPDDMVDSWCKDKSSPLLAKLSGLSFRYAEQGLSQERSSFSHGDRFLLLLSQFLRPRKEQIRSYHSLFPQYHARDLEDLLQMLAAEGLVPYPRQKAVAAYHLRRLLSEHQKEEFTIKRLLGNRTMEDEPQRWPRVALSVDQSTRNLPTELPSKLRTLVLLRDENMVSTNQKCQIKEIPRDIFESLGDLRVLDLRATMITHLPSTVCKMLNLRYLNLSWSDLEMLPGSCSLRNLQTLKLDHCEKLHQLPEDIGNLQNLQVLKLAYCTKLKMLPESVTGLLNLQELDIEGCNQLVELPEDFKKLKKLRYLNITRCAALSRMPRGIQHLTELRSLLGYVAVDAASGSCTIPKLQHLENLEELSIENLEELSNPRDAESVKLQDKRYLRRLQLIWSNAEVVDPKTVEKGPETLQVKQATEQEKLAARKVEQDVVLKNPQDNKVLRKVCFRGKARKAEQVEVLENLEANTALRKLEIVSYKGEEFPKWMREGQPYHYTLVEIKLVNLRRCKVLPPLGLSPLLRIVEITGMDSVTEVGQEFYDTHGRFPSLEKLTFSEMPCLRKWESNRTLTKAKSKEKKLFPRLMELTLVSCPVLEEVEVTLSAIKKLNLWLDNEKLLRSKAVGKLSSVRELEVVGWKHFPDELKQFKNITSLKIVRCEELVSLPDWLININLHHLNICSCYKLSSVPKGLLEALGVKQWDEIFEDCPKLKSYTR